VQWEALVPVGAWEEHDVLIVVKTYPTPSQRDIEVSCTAAITDRGEWMRIFPVPFRLLDGDRRFRKYERVRIRARKASDPRPESYNIDPDSIIILNGPLSTGKLWEARKRATAHLRKHCMCCIQTEQLEHGAPTLGFFRPYRVTDFAIENDDAEWTASQIARLRQTSFLDQGPSRELEKIPYKFRYKYSCDHVSCNGHSMICTDWEISEAYRSWRSSYGSDWEQKFRQRFEYEMLHTKDLHFFVGTVNNHPRSWIIVGLFYPPLAGTDELWENLSLL
jgi:hypothetical protein